MATYTKTTNFTAKDNLTSGDPAKVIKGSEFDTEFNAIETAVNSKANANNGTHTGTTTIATANIDTLQIDGVTVTSTSAELNKLDGFTGDVTDLNKLASVTATATEINVLDGSTATTADLNKLAGVTATSTELNLLDGVTATTAELNFVDGVTSNVQTQLNAKQPLDAQLTDIAGLTPTDGTFIVGNGINFVAESGDTAIASLGITATAAELNYTDGVTSNIQTQLDTKAPIASPTFTGTTTIPTVDINGGTIDGVSITGTTASFSGEISANGGIALGDNDKATFGASDDLQIYHDGSSNSSYIKETGAGSFQIEASNLFLKREGGTESFLDCVTNGAVTAYYDGSAKLTTTATGVDVTGTVTADGLTVDGNASLTPTSNYVSITGGTNDNGSSGLSIYPNWGNSSADKTSGSVDFYGADNDTTNTYDKFATIEAQTTSWTGDSNIGGHLVFKTSESNSLKNRVKIANNGDVSFYEDTGTTAKFVWDSSYESLDIGGNFSDSVKNFGTNTKLAIGGSIVLDGGSGNDVDILNYRTSNLNLGTGGSTDLTIDSSGNVGIGTASPSTNLHVSSSGDTILRVTSADGNGAFLDLGDASDPDGGRIVYDSGSNLAFNTNSSERLRIDSSGNVGIGTASPSAKVDVLAGADQRFLINTVSDDVFIGAVNGTNTAYQELFINGSTLKMATGGSERARIDSSGNLLVGKTNNDSNAVGFHAQPTGNIWATSSGVLAGNFNRKSSDGEIIRFQKDASTVGSIGSYFSGMYIGSTQGTDSYIFFEEGIVRPSTSGGSNRDNAIDLGRSASRFKDLYLSGGVYLGGTGSANKLDDYEEGNFTPVASFSSSNGTLTYNAQVGYYVKTGKTVNVHLHLSFVKGTASGNFRISGLPFTVANNQAARGGVSVGYYNGINNANSNPLFMGDNNTTLISSRKPDGADIANTDLDSIVSVWMQYTYYI